MSQYLPPWLLPFSAPAPTPSPSSWNAAVLLKTLPSWNTLPRAVPAKTSQPMLLGDKHMLRISVSPMPATLLRCFDGTIKYGYKQAPFAAETLAEVGKVVAELGYGVTTHLGQYTQLNSSRKQVIDSSIRDLDYRDEMLFLLTSHPSTTATRHDPAYGWCLW